MSTSYDAWFDGVGAGVQRTTRIVPSEYIEDRDLSESWLDGYSEGATKDVFYIHEKCSELIT